MRRCQAPRSDRHRDRAEEFAPAVADYLPAPDAAFDASYSSRINTFDWEGLFRKTTTTSKRSRTSNVIARSDSYFAARRAMFWMAVLAALEMLMVGIRPKPL